MPEVTRASRIEAIAGMMRRAEWRRGETAAILASEWDLAEKTVEGMAAEASRMVARDIADPERVKVDVSILLLANLQRASDRGKFGDVAKLGDVVTKILGARSPEKVEVQLTEEQARAKYKEITGKDWGE